MTCPLAIELLDFAEDEVDEITKRRLQAHLDGCRWCRRKLVNIIRGHAREGEE